MTRMTHGLVASIVVAFVIASCGGDDTPPATRDSGPAARDGATSGPVACPATCVCNTGSTCMFECGTTGCTTAECLGATCTADCTGGGCGLDCDQSASCDYTCSGGNCTSDCDNSSMCNLACSGGGCTVICDVGSTCHLDCTGAAMPCTVMCEAGGMATCTGNCTVPSC